MAKKLLSFRDYPLKIQGLILTGLYSVSLGLLRLIYLRFPDF
jgi:hypothetical protein